MPVIGFYAGEGRLDKGALAFERLKEANTIIWTRAEAQPTHDAATQRPALPMAMRILAAMTLRSKARPRPEPALISAMPIATTDGLRAEVERTRQAAPAMSPSSRRQSGAITKSG
jgi:hypothetical protein